jgi:NAD(P)-dependent dehydrogenase (short-subunit alcohol dehydrogenase family)
MHMHDTASLITGGSRGLGRALGAGLARAGSRVVLVARGRAALDEAVAAICAAGGAAWGIAADLADKHAIHAIAGEAAALAGPIDILVNNASELGPTPLRLLLDTECEDFERVLAVNLFAPFRLTRVIAGAMALRGGGTVLNISSDAAVEAYPHWGAYGVSKAALDHLSRIWAAELADAGVRVIAVDPGEMATRMHADAMPETDPATLADPARVAARIVEIIAAPSQAASGTRLSAAASQSGWAAGPDRKI